MVAYLSFPREERKARARRPPGCKICLHTPNLLVAPQYRACPSAACGGLREAKNVAFLASLPEAACMQREMRQATAKGEPSCAIPPSQGASGRPSKGPDTGVTSS